MKKLVLLTMVLFCLAATAQSPSTSAPSALRGEMLYDDFSGKWLDPAKWIPANPQCWGNVLECVREIRDNKLRLVARNFGARDSDSGIQWSQPAVYFTNPNLINGIGADITSSFSGAGCPTNNTDYTHTQVQLGGNFFNTGSGNPSDDIAVWLIDWTDSTNPGYQGFSVYWGYIWPLPATDTPFATYPAGTEIAATLKWDKRHHQFIATTKVKGQPDETAERVEIPYPYPDTTPPATPLKSLQAAQNTLNCTTVPTYGEVEATFGDVKVSR
jgi:hypothetical protein